jgi:signal transduction histidine kinase
MIDHARQRCAIEYKQFGAESYACANVLPFIFDRFYRVRNEAVKDIEGNGLGLAIVKSIIEKHGGQISVESEPGKGSCFTFSLPFVQQGLLIVSNL